MQIADRKSGSRVAELLLMALMSAMYLLLIFEVFMPHGGFLMLAAYSLSVFICILVVTFLAKSTLETRLSWISWGIVGVLLNWILGFLCAPL